MLLVSKRMLYVVPYIFWSSISYAIYAGSLVVLMNQTMNSDWSDNKKTQNSLFAMIGLGVGEIVGSIVCGKILDKWNQKAGLIYDMIITAIAFAFLITYNEVRNYGVVTYFMTFFWGLQDAAINTIINVILGFEFESKIIPFSVFKFLQSLFNFALLML